MRVRAQAIHIEKSEQSIEASVQFKSYRRPPPTALADRRIVGFGSRNETVLTNFVFGSNRLCTMGNTQGSEHGVGNSQSQGPSFSCLGNVEKKPVNKGQAPKLRFQRLSETGKQAIASGGMLSCLGSEGSSSGEKDQGRRQTSEETWNLKKEELKRRMRINRSNRLNSPSANSDATVGYFDEPCTCTGICICHYKKAAARTVDARRAEEDFDARIKKIQDEIKKEKRRTRMERQKARSQGAAISSQQNARYTIDI